MTDQTIPADAVRDIIARHRDGASDRGGLILDALKALLPPAPRPTLADMTDEERRACHRMQADVKGAEVRAVILNPDWEDGRARVMWSGGLFEWIDWSDVTPRPDLPRLEWPGTEKPAPAPVLPDGWRLADHKDHGRGVVTTPTPNSDGRVCFAIPSRSPLGYNWHLCYPYDLTYLDTADTVPESTLAVGSEWHDIDALTQACEETGRDQIAVIDCEGDVSVWSAVAGWWETGTPSDGYEPFTIIHPGRKADQ